MFSIALSKDKLKSNTKHRYILRGLLLTELVKKQTVLIYAVFMLISLILISIYTKKDLHLEVNQYHSNFFDVFFKYSTFLGDGVMFGVLFLVFLFVKRKAAYAFAFSGILTLVLVHVFKKIIFKGLPRPAEFIGIENLHIIDGVKMAFWNSFPSGHTTTAFAIFTVLTFTYAKCKSQYLWVSLAIIAGLSRVYLSQHFWMDIFAGSILGILIGFISVFIFSRVEKEIQLT